MEDHSDAVATAARHVAPASRPLIRKEQRIVRSAPRRDLQVASIPRTNVLVVGNPEATRIVVDMLRLDLRGPVMRWRTGQPLDLPSPAQAATLVLENVTRLTTDEQFRVLRWLDDVKGKIRVVSTTSDALWPRVQVGVFNEVLYYRLNTVFVDMGKT
jgi:Sigma-54 interaction domain